MSDAGVTYHVTITRDAYRRHRTISLDYHVLLHEALRDAMELAARAGWLIELPDLPDRASLRTPP